MKKFGAKLLIFIVCCARDCAGVNFVEFLAGPPLGQSRDTLMNNAKTTEQIVEKFGYRFETHQVTAETGHILTLHRLPPRKQDGAVAFVHHGLFGSSDMWVLRGPPHDLAYLLVDAGYDVWLFNARGNTHSRNHTTLDPDKDKAYWDFGVEEMGYYDIPVAIDYVLNVTHKNDMFFLGYSLGSSTAFIACSMLPEYNKKIRLFLGLGPLANIKHKLSPLQKILFLVAAVLTNVLEKMNIYEVVPRRGYFTETMVTLCEEGSPFERLCLAAIFSFTGEDFKQFNKKIFPEFLQYYPTGLSLKSLMDIIRYYLSGRFGRSDFGSALENKLHYNSSIPPLYDLSKVTAPVSLHYGEGDYLVSEEDVDDLVLRLPNVVGKFKVPYKYFNHLDFVIAKNVRSLLYDDLLRIMDKYREK